MSDVATRDAPANPPVWRRARWIVGLAVLLAVPFLANAFLLDLANQMLLADVVPFLILVLMLMVRPWGLFGTREELDRV